MQPNILSLAIFNRNLGKSIEFPLNPIGCVNTRDGFFLSSFCADQFKFRLKPVYLYISLPGERDTETKKGMKTIKFVYSSLIVYFSLANFIGNRSQKQKKRLHWEGKSGI